MCVPDSPANLRVYRRGGGHHGGTGYPMLRLVTLLCCGTRTLIEAVFGSDERTEPAMALDLRQAMRPGMIVLADRHFGYAPTITALAATGADLLVRVRNNHRYPITARLPDGSFISRIGNLPVRIVRVKVTTRTAAGARGETYQLVCTIRDPAVPALELARLYHQRWEIETSFFELKSTILSGRVLRARTPQGLDQELYALLVTHQALRIAIADSFTDHPGLDPDRGSFTIALNTARAQLTAAAGIRDNPTDLPGAIGRQVLAALLPTRRRRTGPRVVKRAISNYTVKTAHGRVRGPSRAYTIEINAIPSDSP
jgi:Transposase DDE domain